MANEYRSNMMGWAYGFQMNLLFLFRFSNRARPIHKLCEYEGNLPDDYEPDCYKDVDESDYACKEKYRIMVSMPKLDD